MTFNPAEVQMWRERSANLEYLIQVVKEPELVRSFIEQLERCKARLREIEASEKADGQSAG